MSETLGICVVTSENMTHLLGVVEAAKRAGKHTEVFFTGEGVHLTQNPDFHRLVETADKMWICEVSYIANGYKNIEIPGLVDRNYSIQARNATMVDRCDRYLIL